MHHGHHMMNQDNLIHSLYSHQPTGQIWQWHSLILQAPRHSKFISVEVCNWKIRGTGKAHFTLLLSGVQPVTILWITTAHVLLSLPCPVHGHLLPLWGGPQLSLCVHYELHTSELWLHSNHIRGRRRERCDGERTVQYIQCHVSEYWGGSQCQGTRLDLHSHGLLWNCMKRGMHKANKVLLIT